MAGTSISFNGNNLQTTNIQTADIDHHNLPVKNAALVNLSHANRSAIPYVSYSSKVITIKGIIVGTSISDCDAQIDTFKSYFLAQDANLDIGYGSGTRRYIATVTDIQVPRPGGLNWAEFTVAFECSQPFGMDTSSTTLLDGSSGHAGNGRTLGSYADSVTFGGSAPNQAPIFTYTLTAVTYIGTATTAPVILGNPTTGQSISINRGWAAADVLVVDCSANVPTVKVNGTIVPYTGAFPYFAPGAGTLSYSDGFNSRTFNETVIYTPRYL